MSLQQLSERVREHFAAGFVKAVEWRGDLAITVTRDTLHEVAQFLRDDPAMDFDYIVHVSSVDWPDDEERFEVVYEFYSIRKRHRIRLKTRVPESDCVVDSLTDLWKGADFMVLDGNPLDDIKVLKRVSFVMKNGRIIKLSGKGSE